MQHAHKNRSRSPLLRGVNQKPIDVGCGLLSASIGPDGLVRSVNRYHPNVGFVTLTPIEQSPATSGTTASSSAAIAGVWLIPLTRRTECMVSGSDRVSLW